MSRAIYRADEQQSGAGTAVGNILGMRRWCRRSSAPPTGNPLRDPAIFEEDGRVYLLYAVAGESGIAIAELWPDEGRRA